VYANRVKFKEKKVTPKLGRVWTQPIFELMKIAYTNKSNFIIICKFSPTKIVFL
jgi:hypothetical protein